MFCKYISLDYIFASHSESTSQQHAEQLFKAEYYC